jgi:two-component system, cell cycle response regulator
MSPTVLAIDDSPSVLSLLEVRLRPERVQLLTASNGAEGYTLAVDRQPDLILLDVDMPDESGLELCRRFKEDPRTAMIPVIFLTASSDVTTKVGCFDIGAIDYVTKSAHPAELRARVRSALRLKRFHDMLAERASVDAMTGLHNRSYFDDRLESEIAAAERYGRRTSLVLIDLDRFKALNDTYGHPFGDEVLQRIAETISAETRSCDAACRYGGEELALILTETKAADAWIVAEHLRNKIRALRFIVRGIRVLVTASLGVAEALDVAEREGTVTPKTLVAAADLALYAAKGAGRDRVWFAASSRPDCDVTDLPTLPEVDRKSA